MAGDPRDGIDGTPREVCERVIAGVLERAERNQRAQAEAESQQKREQR